MWALTLTQPYAWMVIHGPKDVENRDWVNRILEDLIEAGEPFAVHAGKECTRRYYSDAVEYAKSQDSSLVVPARGELVCGAILGTAVPLGYWPPSDWSPSRRWHMKGKTGWALKDRKPLPHPLPALGKQGFWKMPEEIAMRLRAASGKQQAQSRELHP
jgi:hypothetical protein